MAIQKEVERINSARGLGLTVDKYKDSLNFANKLKDDSIKDDDELELGNIKRKKSEWKNIFKKENVGNDDEWLRIQREFGDGRFNGAITTNKLANFRGGSTIATDKPTGEALQQNAKYQ